MSRNTNQHAERKAPNQRGQLVRFALLTGHYLARHCRGRYGPGIAQKYRQSDLRWEVRDVLDYCQAGL